MNNKEILKEFDEKFPYWYKKSEPFDCWEAFDDYNDQIKSFIQQKLDEKDKEAMIRRKEVKLLTAELNYEAGRKDERKEWKDKIEKLIEESNYDLKDSEYIGGFDEGFNYCLYQFKTKLNK